MPGRVLNFLEFSDKYSGGEGNEFSLDDMKNASSNFEEGFDDDTYDLPEIGANRPVSGNDMGMATPASPGEEGAPDFSTDSSQGMSAPSDEESLEDEEPLEDEDAATQAVSDSGDDEDEEEDEEDESTEEGEEEETDEDEELEEGNPEAGANPKKKVEESITLVKGFQQFINESDYSEYYDEVADYTDSEPYEEGYPGDEYPEDDEDGYGMYPEDDTCQECGETPIENEYGYSCGCNM